MAIFAVSAFLKEATRLLALWYIGVSTALGACLGSGHFNFRGSAVGQVPSPLTPEIGQWGQATAKQAKDRANGAGSCWASISICPLFQPLPPHRARLKSTSAYFSRPYQKQVHENTRSKRQIFIFSAPCHPYPSTPTQPGSNLNETEQRAPYLSAHGGFGSLAFSDILRPELSRGRWKML